MAQDIELILSRQLAEYLTTPIALIDHDGRMIYFNESAGHVLGKHFDENGEVDMREWVGRIFENESMVDGIDIHEIPFIKVLSGRHILQGEYWMRNFEEINQKVMIICIPLIGLSQREIGAIIYFNLIHRS